VERVEAEAIYDQGREVVVAVLLRMDEQIERLSERVAEQEERIVELARRLGRNSRNSSLPPSQDPPGTPPRRGKDRSRRQQGGQPATRATGARCCRRGRSMRSSSIGRGGVRAGTRSATPIECPLGSRRAIRSRSCR
jgi:Family of unknown function (DUF6444)